MAGDPGTRVPCPGPLLWGLSGLFALRDVYEDCGGVPWGPIMEDIIFVRRMERMGPTDYLPGPMFSAARRWKGRPVRTLLLWACMQTAFALGASSLSQGNLGRDSRQ